MLIAILVFSIITFLIIALSCIFFVILALEVEQENKQTKKAQKEKQDAEKMATCKDDEVNIMQEQK